MDLGKKLPVIAGGHDCDVAMIGMGLIDENVDAVGDITGTFDHVGYLADRPVNLKKNDETTPLVSYNGPFPGSSVCLGAFPTAGATLEWFMREMNEGTSGADYNKYWSRVQFDGKGSVMVMPTLDGGRGRIDGISVTTTKADLFKAVIEALTFENRRLIEDCAKVKRGQVKRVRIGGGAANSDEWRNLGCCGRGRVPGPPGRCGLYGPHWGCVHPQRRGAEEIRRKVQAIQQAAGGSGERSVLKPPKRYIGGTDI